MELAIVGILPAGAVVGFARAADGCRLAIGPSAESMTVDPRAPIDQRGELISLAMAHFEEQLDQTTAGEGATHQDLAELVQWLAGSDSDPGWTRRAGLVLDAIEDGLPGDAVALSLAALLEEEMTRAAPASQAPPDDPVERLLARASALGAV
jgi:hypothetical protein